MRILHCCLACFYIDNYSYQENILPRYHKKMGNDVRIVASTETFDVNGNFTYISAGEYLNEDGILVTRLPYVNYMPASIAHKLRKYVGLKKVLDDFKPEFIFLHDVQFLDIDIIRNYAQQNEVKIVADCHADFSNSARNFVSKYFLHGVVYKDCAKKIEPYVSRFYGVLPARVDFLKKVYNIPDSKTELLVMAAEDDKADNAIDENIRQKNRNKFSIDDDDFLIVTGGKIDNAKRQTLLLMDAVNNSDNDKVKLVVFGSIIPELKDEIERRVSNKVKYIGWLNSDETYEIFGMADLVCFPGRHSVFWEEVVGIGVPMLVKYWDGTTHVDLGGNVNFLHMDSEEEIKNNINIITEHEHYKKMKQVAIEKKYMFRYSEIADRSLKCY